jgi:hypothetical protein
MWAGVTKIPQPYDKVWHEIKGATNDAKHKAVLKLRDQLAVDLQIKYKN